MLKKLLFLFVPFVGIAQTPISLNDLSAFKNPSANWTIEGGVTSNANTLVPTAGKGVLLCTLRGPKYQPTDELFSNLEHGDIKLSFDFMIPKGSNSGMYLQGRYEVQILDSWLKKQPTDGDCGAIYHRWDESRGKGNEGYEGHAPRQNASKAPGLWNHLDIDFSAPTFDASGKKITNARFNKVVLNGVVIHQNIELLGVTRGAVSQQEVAKGPLRIQGDHGQVAFKNFVYEVFEPSNIKFSPATYEYYEGGVSASDFKPKQSKPTATGTIAQPTSKLASVQMGFLLKFQGKLTIPETGNYTFTSRWNGTAALLVDGDTLSKGWFLQHEEQTKIKNLTAGEHNYTIFYTKDFSWRKNGLAIFIQKHLSEKESITERTSLPDPDPVPLVEVKVADETILQRSFVMYLGKKKTHAISVGMPNGLSYSYDLNQGGFLQLWRGKFLDATQMWHDRGEPQTSEPMGVIINSNDKFPLAYLASSETSFPDTLTKNDLKYKGYKLEKLGQTTYPNFMYEYKGLKVNDITTPIDQSEGLKRRITFEGIPASGTQLYALIAENVNISEVTTNRYSVDNQGYYIDILPTTNKPILRESNGKKQLLMPLTGLKEISYQLIF
ncbi:MAG: family 16 glycoside hydrolase [Bacteroidota bacterium]